MEQGGDYVFPVKENQPTLYNNIQQLFAPNIQSLGLGRFKPISSPFKKSAKVTGALRLASYAPAKCSTPLDLARPGTSVSFATASSNGGVLDAVIVLPMSRIGITKGSSTSDSAPLIAYSQLMGGSRRVCTSPRCATFRRCHRITIGQTGNAMASINNSFWSLIRQAHFKILLAQAEAVLCRTSLRFFQSLLPLFLTLKKPCVSIFLLFLPSRG